MFADCEDDVPVIAEVTIVDVIFNSKTLAFTDSLFSGGNRIFKPFFPQEVMLVA